MLQDSVVFEGRNRRYLATIDQLMNGKSILKESLNIKSRGLCGRHSCPRRV